ncbi:Hypothetical predicted protein [Pelobates cultripes]|uniref:Uncharacterized protein n=1 Tax=Pelobates cultripes TaxID=61616 RepID=A0AAD1R7D2_PELCU|nr:Hypothetical predicted protein [Pelobates cultripes]CAH2225180.1 Hypothetical predicted protein [Pelobates cultripes]
MQNFEQVKKAQERESQHTYMVLRMASLNVGPMLTKYTFEKLGQSHVQAEISNYRENDKLSGRRCLGKHDRFREERCDWLSGDVTSLSSRVPPPGFLLEPSVAVVVEGWRAGLPGSPHGAWSSERWTGEGGSRPCTLHSPGRGALLPSNPMEREGLHGMYQQLLVLSGLWLGMAMSHNGGLWAKRGVIIISQN